MRHKKVRMPKKIYNLYLDDSGTRHPTHKVGKAPKHGHDWFAFGGVLIKDEDEFQARELHEKFCDKWKIQNPLHVQF